MNFIIVFLLLPVITDVTSNGKAESTKDDLSEDELVDEAGWEQVGPKNKSVVTRSVSFKLSFSRLCYLFFFEYIVRYSAWYK